MGGGVGGSAGAGKGVGGVGRGQVVRVGVVDAKDT